MPLSFTAGQNFWQTQKSYVQFSLFSQEVRLACVALQDCSWFIWSQPHKSNILCLHVLRSPCFCQPGRYPMLSTTQKQNTPILGGDALFGVSASIPTLHVDPDPNSSKCCGLNCWLMSHSTAVFSPCGLKRKNSGEETLATLPSLRAGPAWQASNNLLPD